MKTAKQKLTSAELDKKIISMIQSGSIVEKEEGYALLFRKYKSSILFKLSKSLNFDIDTSNDLMMDVFIKIYLRFNSYSNSEGALSTWIFTIVKNTLIDHLKRNKKNNETYNLEYFMVKNLSNEDEGTRKKFEIEDKSESNDSFNLMVRKERAMALVTALNKIKRENVRKALILSYFEEKTYKEISLELEIAENQVKIFLHRGKKELKELLKKQNFNF